MYVEPCEVSNMECNTKIVNMVSLLFLQNLRDYLHRRIQNLVNILRRVVLRK